MDPEEVIARFRTGLPRRFVVSKAAPEMQGALMDIDASAGKVVTIAPWRLAG
jgi:calcineurin-like phosphoesterase